MIYFWLKTALAEPSPIVVAENYHAGQHLSFSDHKIDVTIPSGWTGTAEKMGLLLFSGDSTMVVETKFLPDEEDVWSPFKEPLQLHADVHLPLSDSPQMKLELQETMEHFQQSYQTDVWNAELTAFYTDDGRLLKALIFGPRHDQALQREAIQDFSKDVFFHPFTTSSAPKKPEKRPIPEQILMEKTWTWRPNSQRVNYEQLDLCSNHTFVLNEHRANGTEEIITGTWSLKKDSLSLFSEGTMRYFELKEHSGKLVFQNVFASSTPSDLCKDS